MSKTCALSKFFPNLMDILMDMPPAVAITSNLPFPPSAITGSSGQRGIWWQKKHQLQEGVRASMCLIAAATAVTQTPWASLFWYSP